MKREVCDNCGGGYDKDSEGDYWWLDNEAGKFDDNLKIYFCGKCEDKATATGDRYAIECVVCGEIAHPQPTDREMVRLSPGVFACKHGDCRERYPQVKGMSDKLMGAHHKDKLVSELQKIKDSRTAKWPPRPINW